MNIRDLIAGGESQTVEFKSSLQWDVKAGKQNKELRREVLKTIVAFLNTEGGTLIIGVDDSGQVVGLDADLKLTGNSLDRFEQLLSSLISEYIGPPYTPFIHARFEEIDGKPVYVIEVKPAREPVFLKEGNKETFYVRIQTSSRSLDPRKTMEYIHNRWPGYKRTSRESVASLSSVGASLRSFHTIAVPHEDILEGRLTMDVFAADLWRVFQGKAPDEYQDPNRFFQKTYLTEGLKHLLDVVEKRLHGKGGDPVIQLQTPFGGGKTHTLIAMYHRAREWKAHTVVVVGTVLDAEEDTLWGVMAEQLTGTREGFEGRIAPGREKLYRLLEAHQPVLILMDEVLAYATKAAGLKVGESNLAAQTQAFLQELSETVSTLERACLVVTLPASLMEHYDKNAERLFQQMQKILGRMEKIYTPVQEHEISPVIRRRLFKHVNEMEARENIQRFLEYAERERILPPGMEPSEYRERFLASYPFMPDTIDVLYHRWGSFSSFQRTRGVLRLLSLVIYSLRERNLPYITLADFDLADAEIRRELLKHIGPEFDSVIAADITDETAGARRVDHELGDAYRGLRLGTRTATTIFMHSFSGGPERGATLNEIKRHATTLQNPSSVIAEVLEHLKTQLFYLQQSDGKVYFSNQPNLNRILLTRQENIRPQEIEGLEEKWLRQRVRGQRLKVYIWPQDENDIPDTPELKLVIFREPDTDRMRRFLEQKGNTPRVHRNTLFFLVPIEYEYSTLQSRLREYAALRSLERDDTLALSEKQRKEVKERIKRFENDIRDQIRNAYRLIYIPAQDGSFRKLDMGTGTYGLDSPLDEEVYEKLRMEGEIMEQIEPLVLKERFLKNQDYVFTRQLVESWSRTPGALRVVREHAWRHAFEEGARRGVFGLGILEEDGHPRCMAYKEAPAAVELSGQEILIRADICEAQQEEEKGGIYTEPPAPGSGVSEPPGAPVQVDDEIEVPSEPVFRDFRLQFTLPRGKISDLFGILRLLQEKFNRMEVTLHVSDGEISEQDFENKLQEAFRQLGIELRVDRNP